MRLVLYADDGTEKTRVEAPDLQVTIGQRADDTGYVIAMYGKKASRLMALVQWMLQAPLSDNVWQIDRRRST
jgi:hypothetical protein